MLQQQTECSETCQELLRDLKTTVEGLLANQVANVWSVYGGLNRLHASVEKIFKHGCKEIESNGSYYGFISGLEWLQPESSKSYLSVDCEYRPHIPSQLKNNKASIWLYKSIENHSLSQKLSWLLSDKEHLSSAYNDYSLMRQQKYAEALLTCLRAVERNQPTLLCEIDPYLFLSKIGAKEFHKLHRRCSSYPDSHLRTNRNKNVTNFLEIKEKFKDEIEGAVRNADLKLFGKLKPWKSLPSLRTQDVELLDKNKFLGTSRTTPSTPVNVRVKEQRNSVVQNSGVKKKYLKRGTCKKSVRSKSNVIVNNVVEYTPPLSSSQDSRGNDEMENYMKRTKSPIHKFMPDFTAKAGQKDYKRHPKKSFIEDGGMKVQPVATRYFPKPKKGQTLTSFLKSSQFSVASAQLDKENAHFCISEAMIAAMEQMKFKRDFGDDFRVEEESDPEIVDLKQRIRLRRRQKLMSMKKFWAAYYSKSDTTTTEASASPCSSSTESLVDSMSTDDVEDVDIENASDFSNQKGLSASMASLYSESDYTTKHTRSPPDGASDVLSAEGVALSLISRFNEKQLPRASDLEWLVTEEDAPQALLPLPKSWPVSPDEVEDVPATPLRGTQEWAPPRPQIILTLHPAPEKSLLDKQNYRCAGCSMKVAPKYSSHFRYCDYLGRYFCTGCHSNQLALIPARVLQKWDFTRYPVSNFSYRLLEQMYVDPLYRVVELNKNLTKRSNNFNFCRRYRIGLYHMKDFIFSCRFAEGIQEIVLNKLPNVASDPEIYSMEDLVSIRDGEMKKNLRYLVELCCKHTAECQLCLARGFICEICREEKIIFPWQLRSVIRCTKCGSCFHLACWKPQLECVRCIRLEKRNEDVKSVSQSDDSS